MNDPVVSIVIPTRNRREMLASALDSLESQRFGRWESLIVDDDSDDDTEAMVRDRMQRDCRHRFLRSPPAGRRGAPARRNQGAAAARGRYLLFLDSDDLLAPGCLEGRIRAMDGGSFDFVVFPCLLFSESPGDSRRIWNLPTDEPDLERFLRLDIPWGAHCVLWRTSSFLSLGGWDEDLLSWQDYDLHVRALAAGLRYRVFDGEPDCYWRLPREDTLGRASLSPEHLRSHERLFEKLADVLKEAGMLEGRTRVLLAGLRFWLAERWMDVHGDRREARRVWRRTRRLDLVGTRRDLEGRCYFACRGRRLLGGISDAYLRRNWPADLRMAGEVTFRRLERPVSAEGT